MTEYRNSRWAENGGHPSEDDLRLYVDGELEATVSALVKTHIEACWSCRVKLDEVEETIADFIDYRNQVLRPLVPPPPGNWRGFDARLHQFSGRAGSRSWWSQFVSLLGKPFAELHALAASPLAIRFAVGLLVTLAACAAWIVFNREPVVTATELLQRATEAQTQKILSASQPVVHQQIQIRRKRGWLAQTETARLEIWNDLNNSRFKQLSGQLSGQFSGQSSGAASEEMLGVLERIFQANRLDWRRPLSAVSFAEWRKSLRGKNEEVQRSRLADRSEALSLRTTSTEPPRPGAVLEATLTVRARDWHPFSQMLRIREEGGEAEYELVETAFGVVSLAAVNPAIFAESPATALAAATPLAAPSPAPSPSSLPTIAPTPATASVGLEVETLALLAQARADLGEQVSVERTPDGGLKIAGLVETAERKQELKRALAPVLNSVRFEVETVEEALRRNPPAVASPPAVVDQRATTASALAVEEDLRRYLSSQGRFTTEQLDGEVQQLARRTVNASFSIRQHAQAVKRLVERFAPEQWQAFDEAARARLLDMIEAHAAAVREQGQALGQSLQSIFKGDEPMPATSGITEIASVPDLIRAINQLVELSATSDQAIQAAFTLSTDGAPAQAIKTPAFRGALIRLRQVAGQIQTGVARLCSAPPTRKQ